MIRTFLAVGPSESIKLGSFIGPVVLKLRGVKTKMKMNEFSTESNKNFKMITCVLGLSRVGAVNVGLS